ncbi:MAG: methylmalonyl-CoA mutase family protein [Rhodopila sp.]|jgi:methylmalonyl-CoA mutase
MINKEFRLGSDFPRIDQAAWRAAVEQEVKQPFEKRMVSQTYEGVALQPLYTEAICATGADPSGMPGFPPFVRGSSPLGATVAGWDVRQEHADPNPAEANAHIRDDLANGATSVILRFDAASSTGHDADDLRAADLCGRGGVMISTTADLRGVFDQVQLDLAGAWLDAGGAFLPAAALFVTAARQGGVQPAQLQGSFDADPLGTLVHDGSLMVPLDVALRHMADLASWTAAHAPRMTSVRVSTRAYHDAGATSTQDLAFLLATGVEYLRAMTAAGLDIDAAAQQITLSISLGCRFYQAIAKLRAARLLWGQVVEASGGSPAAQKTRLHTVTGRRVITARNPMLSILRNTAAAYAGAIGGADAITTVPIDAPDLLSPDLSRRNARNTQLILAEECHLNHVVDPAGGSWYVEWYTQRLAEQAWSVFQEIEAEGGMIAAATSGWIAEQINVVEAKRERDIATRKFPITGISEHANSAEAPVHHASAPNLAERRTAAAERVAAWRRSHAPETALRRLAEAARSGLAAGGVTGLAIEAAEAGATIGEIAAALIPPAAEPAHITPLPVHPFDEAYEHLRDAADAFADQHGHRPRVFLAGLGSIAQQIARKTYANSFFQAGGFEVISPESNFSADQAAAAFADSGARIAVICSTDKIYTTGVGEVAPKLKAAGARTVVLAGHPGTQEPSYRAAGVDMFIFIKSNVLETLTTLLRQEGAL